MLEVWMQIARWLVVLLLGVTGFNPFVDFPGSFSLESVGSFISGEVTDSGQVPDDITDVEDPPGPQDSGSDENTDPGDSGPGIIDNPVTDEPAPTATVTPTETPAEMATTEPATEEPTSTEAPSKPATSTPSPSPTPTVPAPATPRYDDPVLRWLPEIISASTAYGVPASLLAAEIKVHSNGYPALAGPGNRFGLAQVPGNATSLYDPQTNLNAAAARLAGFKSRYGTWNAAITADLQGLCDAGCSQQLDQAVREWRAYYGRVLGNPQSYGYVLLPSDWQSPGFAIQVITEPLPAVFPPGHVESTATPTPTPSPTATESPSPTEAPTETPTEIPTEAASTDTPIPSETATASPSATVTPGESGTPDP
jgi:hypothetical protein